MLQPQCREVTGGSPPVVRRKSRAGYAFAHHVEALLTAWKILNKREATTEKRNAADFLFPGEAEYADPAFPATGLRMLLLGGSLNATRESVWLVSLPDFPAALTHAIALPGTV